MKLPEEKNNPQIVLKSETDNIAIKNLQLQARNSY